MNCCYLLPLLSLSFAALADQSQRPQELVISARLYLSFCHLLYLGRVERFYIGRQGDCHLRYNAFVSDDAAVGGKPFSYGQKQRRTIRELE